MQNIHKFNINNCVLLILILKKAIFDVYRIIFRYGFISLPF